MNKLIFIISVLLLSLFIIFPKEIKAARGNVSGDYFASGETVTLLDKVNGDAFLAGGNILFDGTVNGDLLVAGGNVNINGVVNGSVRVAGGNVIVNGKVGKNLSAAAGTFSLGKNAVINGNLSYISSNDTGISSAAVISGQTTKLAPSGADSGIFKKETNKNYPFFQSAGSALNVIGFSLACLFGFFAIKLCPKRTERKMEILSKSFGKTLGVGVLGFIFTPLFILLIAMTMIGIPLAILITFMYLVVIYFAKIWVGYFVGRKLLLKLKMGERRGWALVTGLFIYYTLNTFFFGWLVSLFVIIAGIGVTYREKWEFIKIVKAKKIL